MTPVPPPRRRDRTNPDDFDWPPTADELSVYELGPDPWQKLQDASSEVFAARHGEQPQPTAARGPSLEARQKLASVLAASAIVAAAAGWALYAAMTRPVAVQAVHHPAPTEPVAAAPQRITIRATYPVEPTPSGATGTEHDAGLAEPSAPSKPADRAEAPRPSIDAVSLTPGPIAATEIATMAAVTGPAAPIDAPAEAPMPRPSSTAPAAAPAAPEPVAEPPHAGIRTLLQRYEEAYDRRDVRTAAALWPSLDQGALSRAFAGLDRQDVHFDRCDIDASDARGSAVCVGTVRYVPSVGRATEKEDRITWTFDLARSGEDWRIAGLSAH